MQRTTATVHAEAATQAKAKGATVSITPIPFEQGRFYVQSQSRPILHVVDLQWQEESWHKPKPFCGCEECMAKGNVCRHILAVVDYERKRLSI
jgi:hypothetical protein